VFPAASTDLGPQLFERGRNNGLASGEDLFRKVVVSSHDAILLLSSTAGDRPATER